MPCCQVLQGIFLGYSTEAQWDTEGSGNLSFENFVQGMGSWSAVGKEGTARCIRAGLSKMRQFNRSATEQAARML